MTDTYRLNGKMIAGGGLTIVIFAFFLSFGAYAQNRTLNLLVYPACGYSELSAVQELADDYHKVNPEVEISVTICEEDSGTDGTGSVMDKEGASDLVLASPEKIVTEWGGNGRMADLTLLWDEKTVSEIDGVVREACVSSDGTYYMMPLFKDVYTMAINYDVFNTTGTLQYLNEEAHSWKDSGFIDCVLVMHDYILQHEDRDMIVGKIPCKDQKDQRYFMSFITNLSNGSLTNSTRTAYKISSSSVRNSFLILRNLQGKGIEYDPEMTSAEELNKFLGGELPITFYWSYYRHQKYSDQADFTIFPMMYPNSKNIPVLTGDICGFGVVDNNDEQRIADSVDFIRFVTENPEEYKKAVGLSECFPVRTRVKGNYVSGLYGNDQDSKLFRFFADYLGDYKPTMPLFDILESAWPKMVQNIAEGRNVRKQTTALDDELNRRLEEEYGISEISEEE